MIDFYEQSSTILKNSFKIYLHKSEKSNLLENSSFVFKQISLSGPLGFQFVEACNVSCIHDEKEIN